MKMIVGFVCGIVGMLLMMLSFAVGVICGFALELNSENRKNKATPKYSYADWAKSKKED